MSYNDNNLVLIVSASSDVESAKYECPRLMDSINRTWWILAVFEKCKLSWIHIKQEMALYWSV